MTQSVNIPPATPEITATAAFVEKHLEPRIVELTTPDGRKANVLILPSGLTAHSIKSKVDEYLSAPERRKGTAAMQDLGSFIAHVKRFADQDSALFASPDPARPSITAVLDYHRIGSTGAPQFGTHRTSYAFPLTDEWDAWLEKDGEAFEQKEFAEFIENRIADIAAPGETSAAIRDLAEKLGGEIASPQRLIELSRGLAVREGAAVKNAVNLSSGEAQIQFVTTHTDEDGKPLRVPSLFLIHLPVFRNGAPYEVAVRLRYRLAGGRVTWFYELYRTDKVFDHAFREACETARAETGLPLFIGSPE